MIPTFRRQNVSRWKDGETRSCSHPLTLYMKTYLEPVLPLKFSVVGANYYPSVWTSVGCIFFFNLINWQWSKSVFRVLILSKKAKAPFVSCSPCHVCWRISQWPCSVELGLYCGFLGQLDSQKRFSALITSAFPCLFPSKTKVRIFHSRIYLFLGFVMNKWSKDRTQQLFFPSAPHHGPVFQLLGTFFKISPYVTHLEGNI